MGKGEKRSEKVRKDGKRLKKVGIDSSLIGEYDFSCVANVDVLLDCRFPYLGG